MARSVSRPAFAKAGRRQQTLHLFFEGFGRDIGDKILLHWYRGRQAD